MAGLKDIANEVGVSVRTVSRALNDSGYVSTSVRKRVLEVANKLKYRPNRLARSLRTRKSYEICVLTWSTDALHILQIEAMEHTIRKAGLFLSLLIQSKSPSGQEAVPLIDEVLHRQPAGILCFAQYGGGIPDGIGRLLDANIPYMMIGATDPELDSVMIDRPQGVADAVRYLANQGYQRIAYLAHGSSSTPGNASRLVGYNRAIQELGLSPQVIETNSAQDQYSAGRAAGAALAVSQDRPQAIQAFTDVMAMGLMAGLHDKGLRVPEDIALIGFDNRPAAAWATPPLTTVAQPNTTVGETAAQRLLTKIASETAATPEHHVLPTELIVRESA